MTSAPEPASDRNTPGGNTPGRTAPGGIAPLPLIPEDADPISGRVAGQLFWGFLLLGVAARVLRYALRFPLWEDECFLAVSFIGGTYGSLLEPLVYHQVAPWLFLWSELTAVRLFGFSELSLRLVPLLASLAALALYADMAKRLLRGSALVLAVAIIAVSYPGIRYAAEAKQYATDLFASALMLNLLVRWWTRPGQLRWLWGLAAVAPVMMGLSYPAVFIGGAASVFAAVTIAAWRVRGAWLPWLAFNVALAGGLALVYVMTIEPQTRASLSAMQDYWTGTFPPREAGALPGWLLKTHASDLLAFPFGGPNYASILTTLAVAIGFIALLLRRRALALLCALPFALNLAAALMHRYPYGGHVKFSMHFAPLIGVLAGVGLAAIVGLFKNRPRAARRVAGAMALGLAAVAAGSMMRDTLHPYKTASDARARAFAQWFWHTADFDGQAFCLNSSDDNVGRRLQPDAWDRLSWVAMHVCNAAIYGPVPHEGEPFDPQAVAADAPLRAVLYRDPDYAFDEALFGDWLDSMTARFRLAGEEIYPAVRFDKRERRIVTLDHIHIYTFVPHE